MSQRSQMISEVPRSIPPPFRNTGPPFRGNMPPVVQNIGPLAWEG